MPGKTMSVPDNEDFIFNMMDIPNGEFYFQNEIDTGSAIPINAANNNNLYDLGENVCELLSKDDSYLSTSPNTFLSTVFSASPSGGSCSRHSENYQLRNHDCMWSGRCNHQENHQKMKNQQKWSQILSKTTGNVVTVNVSTTPSPAIPIVSAATKMRHQIQAGQSLLLNSRINKCQSRLVMPNGTQCSKNDENNNHNNRPDTPLSLEGENDGPEFKHHLDLVSCTQTGSNKLPLLSGSGQRADEQINKIKEYLQNPLIKMLNNYDGVTSLNDVISTLDFKEFDESSNKRSNTGGFPMSPEEDDSHSDYKVADESATDDGEEDEDFDDDFVHEDDDEGIGLNVMPPKLMNTKCTNNNNSDDDEEDDEEDDDDMSGNEELADSEESGAYVNDENDDDEADSDNSYSNQAKSRRHLKVTSPEESHQATMHSDHSYTRCKNRVDTKNLGVDTPSDSGRKHFIYIQ